MSRYGHHRNLVLSRGRRSESRFYILRFVFLTGIPLAQGLDSNLVPRTWCCRIGRGLGRCTHFFAWRWS
jgi:hypothetical protein